MKIMFHLNGERIWTGNDPYQRLLDFLRQDQALTGTKEGCGEGECGACAVLVDGQLVNSCLVPLAQVAGRRVQTIEGVDEGDPVVAAFARSGATQCGICTPGMVIAARALLARNPEPTLDDVREALAGNLCRCTGYARIYDAVLEAARASR
jgi:aerobic-type carbon monoxide dehydrogenase small subunit (CoxS/CutS family)